MRTGRVEEHAVGEECGRRWGADLVIELFQSVSGMPSEENR